MRAAGAGKWAATRAEYQKHVEKKKAKSRGPGHNFGVRRAAPDEGCTTHYCPFVPPRGQPWGTKPPASTAPAAPEVLKPVKLESSTAYEAVRAAHPELDIRSGQVNNSREWKARAGYAAHERPLSVGVATSTVSQQQSPHITTAGDGASRIIHSELVGDVTAGPETMELGATGTVFDPITYDLNVGIQSTFEWLSTFARNFTFYRVNAMTFHYVTRSATSTAGSVIMAIEPNPSEPPPESERAAMVYPGAVEFVPWATGAAVHFDRRRYAPDGLRYVRCDERGGDPRLYDFGKLIIATSGLEASSAETVIGKLFVTYDVTLSSPQYDTKVEYSNSSMNIHVVGTHVVPTPANVLGAYLHVPFTAFDVDEDGRDINPLRLTIVSHPSAPQYEQYRFKLPTGNYRLTWTLAVLNEEVNLARAHSHLTEHRSTGATVVPATTSVVDWPPLTAPAQYGIWGTLHNEIVHHFDASVDYSINVQTTYTTSETALTVEAGHHGHSANSLLIELA